MQYVVNSRNFEPANLEELSFETFLASRLASIVVLILNFDENSIEPK